MAASALMPVIWFFLLSFGAGATLYLAMDRGNRSLHHRLQDLAVKFRVSQGCYDEPEPGGGSVANTLLEWAQRRLPAPNLEKPAIEKLVQTLQYAGFESRAAPKLFQAVRFFTTVLAAAAGSLVAAACGRPAAIFVFFGLTAGYVGPIYYVRARARGRQIRLTRELPDVIDLLVVCVECGLGLLAAIRIVGRECEHQGRSMGVQLAMLSAELAAGGSLADGLRGIAQRTGVEDLKTFSAVLVQSERLGTEIGQSLRSTAEQLRIKRSMRAEEAAQKLPVKMVFPLVFFLLPAMMLILVGPAMLQIYRSFNVH
jgi:tight adherence protein C